jgi:hypothetical protein
MGTLHQQLKLAMNADQPALWLRNTIKRCLDAGSDRDAVINELHQLRRHSSTGEEDVILEVLDFLHGWAHPDLKL